MNISRRKIIKSLGMVAGATATGVIPGISLFAREKKETGRLIETSGTRAVLIGNGKRGWRFGKFSLKYPDQLQIVALAEPLSDRRKTTVEALGLPVSAAYNTWKEVFEKKPMAEVAIIAASGNYMQACSSALRAGYHVWVDRPVSMDPDEVFAINQLARKSNRQLSFCYIQNGQLNFMDHQLFEKKPAEA